MFTDYTVACKVDNIDFVVIILVVLYTGHCDTVIRDGELHVLLANVEKVRQAICFLKFTLLS